MIQQAPCHVLRRHRPRARRVQGGPLAAAGDKLSAAPAKGPAIRDILTIAALLALGALPGRAGAHAETASESGPSGKPPPVARVTWTDAPPSIDGRLDDPAWADAARFGGFLERKPNLAQPPPVDTTFRVLVDAGYLYIGIDCADTSPDAVRALTQTRDTFAIFRDDAISVKIDAAHDHRTTLGFVVNPAGARLDYRGINESEFRAEYDAVWDGVAALTDRGWAAELRIPLAVLGIDPAAPPDRIGLNFSRDHARRNATYDWSLMPPPFSALSASLYGHLEGFEVLAERVSAGAALPGAGGEPSSLSWSLVPYLLGGYESEDHTLGDPVYDAGLDATLDVGSRLRTRLTLNTDFAQVDLDDQVVNLSRFGLFISEKRDFFLSDFELFVFGRRSEAQLLHTRRIGLQSGAAVPILGGVKVVARPVDAFRLGFLQVATRPEGDLALPWTSHLVGRGVVELGGDGSNIGVMVTHRQSLEAGADHNLVLGLDGAWRGSGTPILLQAFALASRTGALAPAPGVATGGQGSGDHAGTFAPGVGLDLSWRGSLVRPSLGYAYYHPELRADLGFFRRVAVHDLEAGLQIEPRIGSAGLEKATFDLSGGAVLDADASEGEVLDWTTRASGRLVWDAGYDISANGSLFSETVSSAFTVGDATEIAPGVYDQWSAAIGAGTPSTRAVSATLDASIRDYYGGLLVGGDATLSVRPSTLLRLELGLGYDRASFDAGDERPGFDAAVTNLRSTLTFTPDLSVDLFTGWNLLGDVLQLQARLRWTYHPGSDLFVVLQADLDDDTWRDRFLSALAKLTYRFP